MRKTERKCKIFPLSERIETYRQCFSYFYITTIQILRAFFEGARKYSRRTQEKVSQVSDISQENVVERKTFSLFGRASLKISKRFSIEFEVLLNQFGCERGVKLREDFEAFMS